MTNLEVFKVSLVGNFSDAQIEVFLINAGINPTDEYTKKNAKALDMAKIESLTLLMSTPESVSELDYTVTERSVDDIIKLISSLYSKWGMGNPFVQNKVKSRSVW